MWIKLDRESSKKPLLLWPVQEIEGDMKLLAIGDRILGTLLGGTKGEGEAIAAICYPLL